MVDFEKNIIKITIDDKYKEIIMAKYLNGSSLFTAVNAGLTSSYSVLSNQYTDGVTLENINKSFTNQSILANGNTAAFRHIYQQISIRLIKIKTEKFPLMKFKTL